MSHSVVVGVDGSAGSGTAAEWAARLALRTGRRLRIVHAGAPDGAAPLETVDRTRLMPPAVLAVRDRLAAGLPELTVSCEHVPGDPAYVLAAEGRRDGLLVVGSRGLGGIAAVLLGSTGVRLAAHTPCPVVIVPTGDGYPADPAVTPGEAVASADGGGASADEGAAGEVVVGVEGHRPCDAVLAFAFEQAMLRGVGVRALQSWTPPAGGYSTDGPVAQWEIGDAVARAESTRLRDALWRWREKYPDVPVEAEVTARPAGRLLAEATHTASLVVLGRRAPRLHPPVVRLGAVTHHVLHHAYGPVAIVPHE
ncbi:universal stress protein [Kitasatospora sp. NPDC004240]